MELSALDRLWLCKLSCCIVTACSDDIAVDSRWYCSIVVGGIVVL